MDLRKLKDKATEAFAKGKFAKAAELYEVYCAGETKDLQARLRMGDAFAKAGAKEKAIGAYKFAAEGFAREGFLPRAIAASKLILELDPTHRGVQQMLADLYAKRSAPDQKRRPTSQQLPALPAAEPTAAAHAPSFNEIELPVDEPRPPPQPQQPAPPPAAPAAPPAPGAGSRVFDLGQEEGGVEIELEAASPLAAPLVSATPPPPAAPPPPVEPVEVEEIIADVVEEPVPTPPPPAPSHRGAMPATSGSAPPGLKPKRITTEIPVQAAPPPPEEEVVELTVRKPPPSPLTPLQYAPAHAARARETTSTPAPSPPVTTPVPPPAATPTPQPKAVSRIWLPESFTPPPGALVAPVLPPAPAPEKAGAPAPVEGAGMATGGSDLEIGLAAIKFDELDLDMAPPTPAPAPASEGGAPAAAPPAAKRPGGTFTALELEGDSLLHAVEMAAEAGLGQRDELAEPERAEESMSSVAEDFQGESKTPAGLPKIPLFSDLSADAFIELFDRCPLLRFGQGERIIEQGSVGDSFFVICAGAVRVVRQDDSGAQKDLAVLQEGAFFGEMALLSGAPRTASVISHAEETQLLGISATVLAELSHRYPQVAAALKKFCRQRLLSNVMSSSPLFKPFNRKDRKELVERFRARDVRKNDLIIKEGVPADGLYVVLSGEVKVRKGKTLLATLREGEVFGEISLLQKSPATATVVAAKRTSLLRLPREAFDQVILTHPQVLMLVSELSESRQRHTAAALSGELLV